VPKHSFFFHDISELKELWDRTRWKELRGYLEYDIRMAITGGCGLMGEKKRNWVERGQDIIDRVVEMVARDAGCEDGDGVELFIGDKELMEQDKGRVGRCEGTPVVIKCGNGEVARFWCAKGRIKVRTGRGPRIQELPYMFMGGNLGGLPFLGEMLAQVD
jgi:hypothetical protein